MHLGNVFSCLCSWLSARSQGGSIVLRIEDLDDRCKRPELAAQLIDDLTWLGARLGRRPLLPARSPGSVRSRLAPIARRRPHLSLLLHARRAPRRERTARERRHAHLPWRLPNSFGRGGGPPQRPARPGHTSVRAHRRRPSRRRDRICGPHVRGPMRGARHRVRRLFWSAAATACLPIS